MSTSSRAARAALGVGANSENETRFIASEKFIHWSTALLFVILLGTGAILYIPALTPLVGDRAILVEVHIYAGFLVLLPLSLAFLYTPAASPLRSRLRELSRWGGVERQWTRHLPRLDGPVTGRFNAGQKLNGAFSLAALVAMLATGLVMGLYIPLPIYARQGATFVHDLGFYLMGLVFVGHLLMVAKHRGSLSSMAFRIRKGTHTAALEQDETQV